MKIFQEQIRHFRFHHLTDEVYGDLKMLMNYLQRIIIILHLAHILLQKASSDHLVRAWNKTYGLPTIITNCSNNYGPFHFPENSYLLAILRAIRGEDIPIYGDGLQV